DSVGGGRRVDGERRAGGGGERIAAAGRGGHADAGLGDGVVHAADGHAVAAGVDDAGHGAAQGAGAGGEGEGDGGGGDHVRRGARCVLRLDGDGERVAALRIDAAV